jgi:predicted PurR-regulated permease PerM
MAAIFKIPFYARVALIFISIFAFVFVLHIGRDIIVPVVFATIIAIVLNPFVELLRKWKVNRVLAISIAVVLASLITLAIIYVISYHLAQFSESLPQLKTKVNASSKEFVNWISETFNIRTSKINLYISNSQADSINNFEIAESLAQIGGLIVTILLLPCYLFMILYYKPLLLDFIYRVFDADHQVTLVDILANTKQIIQTYLVGLFFELIIMAVLNSVGLLILGIEYAIILGILGALLNTIPYIGGVVATGLAMIIAFVTTDSITYPVLVLALFVVIQLIDNNFIVPIVVASRVKINALISVIAVLIGGSVWGIPGMFLSIPLVAILKVIFDHVEALQPWGLLLGNILPPSRRRPQKMVTENEVVMVKDR